MEEFYVLSEDELDEVGGALRTLVGFFGGWAGGEMLNGVLSTKITPGVDLTDMGMYAA